MDYETLQKLAKGVVEASAACDGQLFTGTVTNASPLSIKLGEESGSIEIDGDDIILTQSVVSKKIYIKKHTHKIGQTVATHTHPASLSVLGIAAIPPGNEVTGSAVGDTSRSSQLTLETLIVDRTLDAWCTEYGHKLPVDPGNYNPDGEQVCITINRGLEKGDKVIMSRVSHGQQFIVLSRAFEVDKPGEDDN
jgi:hypothetical protein